MAGEEYHCDECGERNVVPNGGGPPVEMRFEDIVCNDCDAYNRAYDDGFQAGLRRAQRASLSNQIVEARIGDLFVRYTDNGVEEMRVEEDGVGPSGEGWRLVARGAVTLEERGAVDASGTPEVPHG